VILIVPMCILSSMAGVWMSGMDNNIFTQIGFIVLVGLASKNAILIVEFAKQRQEHGLDRFAAVMEAAKIRLRPILMTSFAFILGVFPLVVAEGAGAESRRILGTAVFSGSPSFREGFTTGYPACRPLGQCKSVPDRFVPESRLQG
jgi:multidrug efflux pump